MLIVAGSETRRMYGEYCAWRGIEVREAGTAAEAMRQIAAALPDAVVISERLPDCTGRDLVRALRRSRHTFSCCVILLASNTFLADALDTSKHGCDVVLTVPVLPDHLVAVLEEVLRDRAERRASERFESWLFLRSGESVWMVRTAPLELTIAGPRDRRAAFHFDDERGLQNFQAHYQNRLLKTGFVLEAAGADRRSGRERRSRPRDAADRRGIQ